MRPTSSNHFAQFAAPQGALFAHTGSASNEYHTKLPAHPLHSQHPSANLQGRRDTACQGMKGRYCKDANRCTVSSHSGKLDIQDDHASDDQALLSEYLAACYMPRVGQLLLGDEFYGNYTQVTHEEGAHVVASSLHCGHLHLIVVQFCCCQREAATRVIHVGKVTCYQRCSCIHLSVLRHTGDSGRGDARGPAAAPLGAGGVRRVPALAEVHDAE